MITYSNTVLLFETLEQWQESGKISEFEGEYLYSLIQIYAKETAKNVRHKACDVALEQKQGLGEIALLQGIQRRIMNIEFSEIEPK